MRDCWESGVVLAGPSAGSLCWHLGGPTDSFGDALPGKRAWWVQPTGDGGYSERAITPRLV